MNIKIALPFLFSLLLTNHMILIADFWSDVNPINLCKRIKKGIKDYGAGQQALDQVKAQQKIIDLLANNSGTGACAEQLEQIVSVSKETNAILQDNRNATYIIAASMAVGTAVTLKDQAYRFYKWMWPSEEEIKAAKIQRERNNNELKMLLTHAAIGCLQDNSPELVNRCKQVFTDYSQLVGSNALTALRKSVNHQAP